MAQPCAAARYLQPLGHFALSSRRILAPLAEILVDSFTQVAGNLCVAARNGIREPFVVRQVSRMDSETDRTLVDS
jgi:hypothetical protein